jgi:hypothetical protein
MSAAREASHPSFTRPAAESTRSEEPTFTTMRRKSCNEGDDIPDFNLGIKPLAQLRVLSMGVSTRCN